MTNGRSRLSQSFSLRRLHILTQSINVKQCTPVKLREDKKKILYKLTKVDLIAPISIASDHA